MPNPTGANTPQKDPVNKPFWKSRMHSEFKKAALGVALMVGGAAPFWAGMTDIWAMRAAVTTEQIATHPSRAANIKSCENSTFPAINATIQDCVTKRTRQSIISAAPAFKGDLALAIGGFTGIAGGLLMSVACAGAALDARRKYRGNTPS